MMKKIDPERFLYEVFDENFYPQIGLDRRILNPKLNQFYDDIFPDLRYLTKKRQAAIDLVDWAILKDIKVVIATNPLFPLKAIQHRLRWAGLAPEDYPYALVTSFENSHFTKENVSYFPEILGQLGWPEGPVVMVGNDLKMDIEPALAAGFPVFWVHDEIDGPVEREEIPQGRIDQVRTWLESTPVELLQHSTQNPSALVATLRSTPAVLEDLFSNLNEETMSYHMNPDDWSIKEVVCHLRDVEIEVNLPRIQKVLSQENSFVTGVITDPWVVERNYAGQSGQDALREYIKARKETIEKLNHLQLEWGKSVRHSIFGKTTLLELVNVIVGHDKAHIQQIHQVKTQLNQ
jgi:FMN phosphatase YigB (HAD superfamily)